MVSCRIRFARSYPQSESQQKRPNKNQIYLIARIKHAHEYAEALIPRALLAFPCRSGKQDRTTVSRANGSPWRSVVTRISSNCQIVAAGGTISRGPGSISNCAGRRYCEISGRRSPACRSSSMRPPKICLAIATLPHKAALTPLFVRLDSAWRAGASLLPRRLALIHRLALRAAIAPNGLSSTLPLPPTRMCDQP
jgi:hypothetical protein